MGYSCMCVCVCLLGGWVGRWGRGGGATFVFAPLGDSESCMPGPKASAQGADMMWGWPHWGRRGAVLGGEGFFFQIFEKRQTHIFFPPRCVLGYSQAQTDCITRSDSQFKKRREREGKKNPPIPSFLNIPENLQSINLQKPLI